ncbi:M20 family metallo-hydrolase [Pectinatus haikarae]|uniref:M20 family metallo-hydrolase n=1 Tax=Pectinatus haikarae TaxID=349096 RepID=UPI002EDA7CF8
MSTTVLEAYFAEMRKFSLPGEGVTRIAFSDEDWQARAFIIDLMKQEKLAVRVDGFGNIIGRREGLNAAAPAVVCGSHIDSVPNGGNFDGVLGVLGAIEAVKLMDKRGFKNYNPLEIVVFMCEESSRFGVATLGSRAICGGLGINAMKQLKDAEGISLYEILRARGLDPENMKNTLVLDKIKACLEMHIEQGKVLESMKKSIGIVTGIAAPTRLKLKLTGKADHSGATPMHLRNDALCAAAEIILEVERTAAASVQPVVGTVGIVRAFPNVMNVIPGQVELGIDIRSIYMEAKDAAVNHIKKYIENTAKKRNIKTKLELLTDEKPVKLDRSVIDIIEDSCRRKNIEYHLMSSGAGHDMMHLAQFAPTGMIFVPCRDGISHNPAEWTEMAYIEQGIEILYASLCRLSEPEV